MIKKVAALVSAVVAVLVLAACSKEIDVQAVGATHVPGTANLWWFCDTSGPTPTLIYFEKISGADEYVLVWPGACEANGKPKDMGGQNPQQPNLPGENK